MPDLAPVSQKDQASQHRQRVQQDGACALCGLPLGRSKSQEKIGEAILHFCCPGCKHVFVLLSNEQACLPSDFRETDLYRACVESGVIPDGRGNKVAQPAFDVEPELPPLDLVIRAEGMWCPACAWLIEEILRRTAGVLEPQVSFLSDMVQLRYLPHVISPAEIMSNISRLGYRASLWSHAGPAGSEKQDHVRRLGISAILTANVMMISFALYFGFVHDLSQTVIAYFSYPLAALATAVVFYGGLPILRRAAAGLRYGATSMDTLISLGGLAAYFYSLVQMARGSIHLYFDTACMLMTLVLLGRYIEMHAREKVSSGVTELCALANQKVRLLSDAREHWVSPDAVSAGDRFAVRSGERSPIDGRIIEGRSVLDESILTGESRPVQKGPGDDVMAGSLVIDEDVVLTATRAGSESSLHQLVSLVQEALARKNPVEVLADRITRWFVPVVLAVAATTALLLWVRHVPADEILLRALTILLIACPCALGIATPLVKVAMIGIGRSRGILVRDPGALERAKDLDVLIFDKTGTVTEGSFVLQEVVVEGLSEQEVLARVAAVEAYSSHFLAREIGRRAHKLGVKLPEAERIEELQARGVKGLVQEKEVFVGNRRLIEEGGIRLPVHLDTMASERERTGRTVIFFGWDDEAQGILVFGDPVRPGTGDLVRRLQDRGITVWLVSGDARGTTAAVATFLGIDKFRGQMLPAEKADLIGSLKREGHRVGMVGDGLNDAAALARADAGFSLGVNATIIGEASDVTILSAEPVRILDALQMSELAARTIRQNLSAAFCYNVVAIPFAVSGLLNPLIAVVAMFGSSVFVIGNALRISRRERASRHPGLELMTAEAMAEGAS